MVSVVIFEMLEGFILVFEGQVTIPTIDGIVMAGVLLNPPLDISHANLCDAGAKSEIYFLSSGVHGFVVGLFP